jgi:hypothetical protein
LRDQRIPDILDSPRLRNRLLCAIWQDASSLWHTGAEVDADMLVSAPENKPHAAANEAHVLADLANVF